MYEYPQLLDGTYNTNVIRRISDGAYIPIDEMNTDYQQYLKDTKGGLKAPDVG